MIACFLFPRIALLSEHRRRPETLGGPLALANAQGLVVVASEEAERFGIRPGMKVTGARSLCGDLIVSPYSPEECSEVTHPLWDCLAVESSIVEPVSPEVAFIEIREIEALDIATHLVRTLDRIAGTEVRAGLGRTRSLARAAAEQAAPGKVVPVAMGMEAEFLRDIPVNRVLEDPLLAERLERLGIRTLGDVRAMPEGRMARQMGGSAGKSTGAGSAMARLSRLARGEDRDPVRALWPPPTLREEARFDFDMDDRAALEEALRQLAERISERLRRERVFCRTLTLEAIPAVSGVTLTESETLSSPLCDTSELHRASLRLLDRMEMTGVPGSVSLEAGKLTVGSGMQLTLIDENEHAMGMPHERANRLKRALSFISKRFGSEAVHTLQRAPSRIHLWVEPLGSCLREPLQIEVEVGEDGLPVRYLRRGIACAITEVRNRWCETENLWGVITERMVYRVEVETGGISELCRLPNGWYLTARAD